MQSRPLLSAAAIACVIWSSAAPAKNKLAVLEPTTQWNIDYSDDSCALRRLFGEPGKQVLLEMRSFSPGEPKTQLSIRTDGWRMTRDRDARYRFEPGQTWRDALPVYATFGRKFDGVFFSAGVLPPEDEEEREAAEEQGALDPDLEVRVAAAYASATGISIADAFNADLTLRTGSLKEPHKAMQTCLEELLTHWGIDAEAHRSLSRRAVPEDLPRVVRAVQRDYPAGMLVSGMQGLVRVRLAVDATGKVTDCRVQQEISEAAFEKASCENLRSAKFKPALDKEGAAIASYWTTSVIYVIGS